MRFLSSQELEFTLPPEEKSHGTISITTYYKYFKAGASLFVLAIMLVFFVLGEVRTRVIGIILHLAFKDNHDIHREEL